MIFVSDILRLCQGKLVCGNENLELISFCTDSRVVQRGDVYVGIRGEVFDGSDFYREAIEKGASVCILEKEYAKNTYGDCTVVIVEDAVKCLQVLAKYKRSLFSIPVIGVTGSVGKTSCKDLIYSVLSRKYRTHRTIGNYNNHLGVPLTVLGLCKDDEAMVVEMGMNHLGEIKVLSEIAQPTISVITNVGTAHIGNLGSRENILKAKLEILEGMCGTQVILNQDNDMLSQCVESLKEKYAVSTIGIYEKSDYQAKLKVSNVFDSCFDILGYEEDVMVQVGGIAYVYNALFAYAVGCLLGISSEEIRDGIYHFKLSSHRLEKKVNAKGTVIIDDTYNANYDSMVSSLSLLGNVQGKRRVAILGDMLELGEYAVSLHCDLGDVVVKNLIDVLITVGSLSEEIGKRAIMLGMDAGKVYHFEREKDSYLFLKDFVSSEDIVLVKGSHGIHLIGIVDMLMDL